MPTDTLIHLRVPALTKARWVRESRASGMRLGEWIAAAVEAQHPDCAYCPLCGHDITPLRTEDEVLCPRHKLVL
jgi:hypothetical protein